MSDKSKPLTEESMIPQDYLGKWNSELFGILVAKLSRNPHGFQLFILKRSLKKVIVSVYLSLTALPSPLHRNS